MISKTTPVAPNDLLMVLKDDGQKTKWSQYPNVFGALTNRGKNVALIGWYHPYGRIIGSSLSTCLWYEDRVQLNSNGSTLFENMINQTRSLVETPRFSIFGQSLTTKYAVEQYQSMLRDILQYSADDRYSLVFVHIPVPHAPRIYDRNKREVVGANDFLLGYFENVELVDVTVGKVMQSIKNAGLWDETAILVTGDHSWRHSYAYDSKYDKRVPFILKLPWQKAAIIHNIKFNSVVTSNLVKSIVLDNENNIDRILRELE
jgi:membrane-anchored protein YejM (alkaline phosphatase superfamily)